MRNSPADTKMRVQGEAVVLQVPEQTPLQLVEETTVEQVSLCRQWRQPCQSGWLFLKKCVCHEEPMLEQVLPTGTAAGRKHTLDRVYPGGLQPVERAEAGAVLKSSPWERIMLEQGKSLRRKEHQEVLMDSLQSPTSHPQCTA